MEETVLKQGLAKPVSDNDLTVHALMSANIQLLVQLIRFILELLVLPDQSTKDVKRRLCFLYLFLISILKTVLGTLADYSRFRFPTNGKRGCSHLPA